MSILRGAAWAVTIGVFSVVVATLLFRIRPLPAPIFVVLLIWWVGALSAMVAAVAGIQPSTGAIAGVIALGLVCAVFAATVASIPLEPGATRPGFANLLWMPLFVVLAVFGLCGAAGYYGVRAGLYIARRRRQSG